jgi:hypothetical protein
MPLDRFRWVHCQLDTLCRCLPSSIPKVLKELPISLNETYERILQGIHRERRQHATRLLQCMVVAIRPLRVEELVEVLAIDFNPTAAPKLVKDWRTQDQEDSEKTLLSTCSTLISIIDDGGAKIVQFSHFTVKEFLTSDHLETLKLGDLCRYYIPLDLAHTTLVQACLTILLQLDEKVDKKQLATFPLAFYAAQNWVDHARFKKVTSQIQDSMERLFNPKEPYFRAWIWIHDLDKGDKRLMDTLDEHPPLPKTTPLYYAVSCGFSRLAKHLIAAHAEDVNAKCGRYGTPLHAASIWGHVDAARVLLEHGADKDARGQHDQSPLLSAYSAGQLEVMQLLLEHGVDIETQHNFSLELY